MRIAQLAPLVESVPPKLYGGTERVVACIISLAESLNAATVAEGVEEPGQRAILSELGCARAQGYLFARPLPVADFEAYAMRRRLRPVEDVA